MLPYFNTCIGVYKIVTECSPEVIMTYNCNIFELFRPYCWWISHNYNVLNDRSVPIHVLQLVGPIDHGGGCSIWQSGRMIQYWARRARNQGDLSSSMLRGESITYGMLQEIRLLDLHIKTKNAFCKYSGLQHRLQHSFKYTATTASEQHPLLGYVQGDGETV